MRLWSKLLIAMSCAGVLVASSPMDRAQAGAESAVAPHVPASFDLSGETEGRWIADDLGSGILVRHPASAFPDGELSNSGIVRETSSRRKVRGRWVTRKRLEVVASPSVFRDDRVLVLIPASIRWDQPIQLVVYLHGWRAMVAGASSTVDEHHLRETLECARTNAILVMPQGPYNYPSSRFGRLEKIEGLAAFLRDLGPLLPPLRGGPDKGGWLGQVGQIVLAGHSGGGAPITKLLEDAAARGLDAEESGTAFERWMWQRITRIVLLDATYNGQKALEAWWEAKPGRSLLSYFLVGTSTAGVSEALANLYVFYPERRDELDIEGISAAEMPGELRPTAHYAVPWYRLWRGLGSQTGLCRWSNEQPSPIEPARSETPAAGGTATSSLSSP